MNITTDCESPIPGMKTEVWGSPLTDEAFRGLVSFASAKDEFITAFLKENPKFNRILRRRSPIEKMVDQSSGFEDDMKSEMVGAFADWVNVNLWGDGSEPEDGARY